MTLTRITLAGLALALVGAAAAAAAPVEALRPWSRPAVAGATAVGYVTLVNHGRPDRLIGAESPLASRVETHASSISGGVMRMAPEPQVALPAGGQVSFAPGGRHLMFVGLKRPLKSGDKLPATLRFASGARLKVEFRVGSGAGEPQMPAMKPMPGMHH